MSTIKTPTGKNSRVTTKHKRSQNTTANPYQLSRQIVPQRLQNNRVLSPADMMHLQRTIGNQATRQLFAQEQVTNPLAQQNQPLPVMQSVSTAPAHSQLQRWSIKTGWGAFSKAGHEKITAESVNQVYTLIDNDNSMEDEEKKQAKAEISKALKNLKRGARWNDMLGHSSIIAMGLAINKNSSLTHQSHEGEMQFLHGMAAKKSE
ncbi:hypothetical protein ACFLYO_11830, partial [Chloroflexota bacterium]